MSDSIYHRAVATTLILLVISSPMLFSQRLFPESATLVNSADVPHSGRVRLAHYPNGGFALFRTIPVVAGARYLEGYNDTLGLRWRHLVPFHHNDEQLLWLGYHTGSLVSAMRRWLSNDSIAFMAYQYNPLTGVTTDSTLLGVQGNGIIDRDLRVIPTRVIPSADSSLLVAYSVDFPPEQGSYIGFDSVRIHLHMFDGELHPRGTVTLSPPILHIDRVREAEFRLHGAPVVDSKGRFYIGLAVGPTTVRFHRIDIGSGATSSIDLTTAPVEPDDDRDALQEILLSFDESGRLMVATTEHDKWRVSTVTLSRLDFERNAVEFTKHVSVTASILSHPDADDMVNRLRLRSILPAGRHGSLIMLEEVLTHGVPSFARAAKGAIMPGQSVDRMASHKNIVALSIDTSGGLRWTSVQKRGYSHHDYEAGYPDLWRIDGDTMHYLTGGLLVGTMDLNTGSLGEPRALIETDMNPVYEFSRWIDSRSAILLLRYDDYNGVLKLRF